MTPLSRSAKGRYARLAAQAALVIVCAGLAAACGSAAAPSSSSGGSSHSGHTVVESKVVLEITLHGETGPTQHWTLRCDPPSGNTPDAAAKCNKLLASTIFNPPKVHYMCPMIMSDARVFTITGILNGKHVSETVTDGGCDLARYATLHQIFN